MRVLLVSTGTAGNVLPFVGWGKVLRARGHEVFLLSEPYAQPMAEREGLRFVKIERPEVPGGESTNGAGTLKLLQRYTFECLELVPRVYRAIAECHVPGETVVASLGWFFGARIAQEHLDVPLATVHLQPLMFGNLHESGWLPEPLGLWCRRMRQGLIARLVNWRLGRSLNRFRQSLGLHPVRDIKQWYCSPELVVGMFPSWFAPSQPDWPSQTILGGFPPFDELEPPRNVRELDEFLADGSPPLVFSYPTSVKANPQYFTVSAEVAQRLGRRAILLSLQAEQPDGRLPPGVRYFGFVPLSRVLPRAAAVVHHGGMGTLSQALAAGIPQVAVPRFLDQFDNCRKLERLGTSVTISSARFRADVVAGKLAALLESAAVRDRCRHYAELSRRDDCFATASAALEDRQQLQPCPAS